MGLAILSTRAKIPDFGAFITVNITSPKFDVPSVAAKFELVK